MRYDKAHDPICVGTDPGQYNTGDRRFVYVAQWKLYEQNKMELFIENLPTTVFRFIIVSIAAPQTAGELFSSVIAGLITLTNPFYIAQR